MSTGSKYPTLLINICYVRRSFSGVGGRLLSCTVDGFRSSCRVDASKVRLCTVVEDDVLDVRAAIWAGFTALTGSAPDRDCELPFGTPGVQDHPCTELVSH